MAEPISRAKWEKSDPSGALLLCSAHPGLRLLPVLWWVHPHVLLDHLVKVFNQSHSCWQVCESPTTATRQTGAQILSGGKQGAFHHHTFWACPEDGQHHLTWLVVIVFSNNCILSGHFGTAHYQQRGRDEVHVTALISSPLWTNTFSINF